MKTLIAITFTVLSFGSLAHAQSAALLAEVKGVSMAVADVQLFGNGQLVIHDHGRGEEKMQLSKSNAQYLTYLAQTLSNVELKTVHSAVTCKMIVNPMYLNELSVTAADGSLRLVLSPATCALADHTFPKNDGDHTLADELKEQLIAFAHQLAGD